MHQCRDPRPKFQIETRWSQMDIQEQGMQFNWWKNEDRKEGVPFVCFSVKSDIIYTYNIFPVFVFVGCKANANGCLLLQDEDGGERESQEEEEMGFSGLTFLASTEHLRCNRFLLHLSWLRFGSIWFDLVRSHVKKWTEAADRKDDCFTVFAFRWWSIDS